MFQNLRSGSPFYILYKNELKLSIGEVVNVGVPVPQYGTTYQNGVLSTPKSYVDVKVNVNGEEINLQKLPADLSIADFGTSGMVVSENREAITNEIDAIKSIRVRELSREKQNKEDVVKCDQMLAYLNPHLAKEAEQNAEMENLKKKIESYGDDIAEIKSLLKSLGRNSSKS